MLPDAFSIDTLCEMLRRFPANQEAVHRMAYDSRRAFEEAKKQLVMSLIGNSDYRAVAFSSGTAAISVLSNWKRLRNKSIATTKLEHPAVSHALKRAGAKCVYLKNDSCAGVEADCPESVGAVFIHHVQSELGRVQNADEIFSAFPGAIKIADTIQSAAKIPLPLSADILTVSGSKFGVPGTAALLVKKEYYSEIEALAEAGRAEYRSSRLIVPHFLAMAQVAAKRMENISETLAHIKTLQRLCRELAAEINVRCTIPEEFSSPWICHLSLDGKDGAVVTRLLSESDICVGSGSACSAETGEPSAALRAIGYGKKEAFSGLRISFSQTTEEEDVKKLFEVLEKTLKNY